MYLISKCQKSILQDRLIFYLHARPSGQRTHTLYRSCFYNTPLLAIATLTSICSRMLLPTLFMSSPNTRPLRRKQVQLLLWATRSSTARLSRKRKPAEIAETTCKRGHFKIPTLIIRNLYTTAIAIMAATNSSTGHILFMSLALRFQYHPEIQYFCTQLLERIQTRDMWKDTSVNYTHPSDRQNGDMPEADIDLSFSRKSPPSPLKTPTRISEMNHYFDNSTSNVGVSFLESNGSTSSLSSTEINVDLESRVFNTFAFMPKATSSLVVPPNYAHYNFALYPLPTHVLPMFREVVKTRFSEIMPTGLMVICYPTSLKMYNNCILPCLDLTLHQMLALNLISTHACEELTVPPSAECYSYEAQKRILEELPQAEILYSRQIIDYKASDWGYRWMSEDMMWIRETLAAMHVPSQTILKFMNMLTRNFTWSVSTDSDVSLFIVRKKPSWAGPSHIPKRLTCWLWRIVLFFFLFLGSRHFFLNTYNLGFTLFILNLSTHMPKPLSIVSCPVILNWQSLTYLLFIERKKKWLLKISHTSHIYIKNQGLHYRHSIIL